MKTKIYFEDTTPAFQKANPDFMAYDCVVHWNDSADYIDIIDTFSGLDVFDNVCPFHAENLRDLYVEQNSELFTFNEYGEPVRKQPKILFKPKRSTMARFAC